MLRNRFFAPLFALTLLGSFMLTGMAGATESPPAAKAPAGSSPSAIAAAKLDERGKKLMDVMDENQTLQFASIRTSYGTIRSVQNVQQSIDKAVTACGEVNPGIKDTMDDGFENWRMYIRPTMRKAESKLEKMIMLQTFARPSEVRSYLKLFDDAVAARDAEVKKEPIVNKEECIKLLKRMADTQEKMVSLLNKTLYLDKPIKQKDSEIQIPE